MKKPIAITLTSILLVVIFIYGFNYFQLQSKMNEVIKDDFRNRGVKVSVHYGNYINPAVLIYDLKTISYEKSPLDVFRVFLQFADEVKFKKFKHVILSFRGKAKFMLSGDYFQKIGLEYSWQNPIYTIQTFSQNLMNPDGLLAYPEWTGGFLGVSLKQMEDFNDFNEKWYLDDIVKY